MTVWLQTARAWGNDRIIRGVVHALPDDTDVLRAACGYVPDLRTTTLVPPALHASRCEQCERKEAPRGE